MEFHVGDSVVKPGLGICKIKAIRKLEVDGKQQSFYALQSGEANVMIPFEKAHKGAIRMPISKEEMEKIYEYFHEPIVVPKDEYEEPEMYPVDPDESHKSIKEWEPHGLAKILKHTFYKEKMGQITNEEKDLFKQAMALLSEEFAHLDRTIRPRAMHKIKNALKEGRTKRKEVLHH